MGLGVRPPVSKADLPSVTLQAPHSLSPETNDLTAPSSSAVGQAEGHPHRGLGAFHGSFCPAEG